MLLRNLITLKTTFMLNVIYICTQDSTYRQSCSNHQTPIYVFKYTNCSSPLTIIHLRAALQPFLHYITNKKIYNQKHQINDLLYITNNIDDTTAIAPHISTTNPIYAHKINDLRKTREEQRRKKLHYRVITQIGHARRHHLTHTIFIIINIFYYL